MFATGSLVSAAAYAPAAVAVASLAGVSVVAAAEFYCFWNISIACLFNSWLRFTIKRLKAKKLSTAII